MQRLIAVGFGVVNPVAQAVGMRLVYLAYGHIYLETFVDLVVAVFRDVYYADGQDVVNLLEGDVLVLHLVPDAVGALHACFQLILYAHLVEGFAYGLGEVGKQRVALLLRL